MWIIQHLKAIIIIAVVIVILGACASQPPLLTQTPTQTAASTLTATVQWFPSTRTSTPIPTTILTPSPEPRSGLGSLLLSDSFVDGAAWSLIGSQNVNAAVANNHLTLAVSQSDVLLLTTRNEPLLDDFYAQVTVDLRLCSGADEYGLYVRVASAADFYRFTLTCNGHAKLDRVFKGVIRELVPLTFSGAVPSAVPSESILAVWVKGEEIRFFINGFFLFEVQDSAIPKGTLGFYVRTREGDAVTVNFSDLEVFSLQP
jgi:hypothetical protein